jgi:hypothetical protein
MISLTSGVQLEEVYLAIASLCELRRMKEVNLYPGGRIAME